MVDALRSFFETISWPMTPPPCYGTFHILYTLIGFAVCAIVAWKLRNVSDKAFRGILFGFGVLLAVSEVFKQLLYYFVVMDGRYAWDEFPFQLCSVPMYLCLIAPWLKPGKVQRGMYSFMVLYNLLGGAISFAEPSGLMLDRWFLTVHALAWHMLLVFLGLFICFSKRGGNEQGDYRSATGTFLVLCVIAFGVNCAVQFGLHKHINMFFVGPGNSPLAVFSLFSKWFGWYVNTLIYVAAVCLGAYLIFLLIYYCQNRSLPFRKKQLCQ